MEFWPKSWKVMEFHVGKFVCSRAAYCSGLSDMYAGKNIKLRQYVNLLELCRRFLRPRDSLQRNCIIATEIRGRWQHMQS